MVAIVLLSAGLPLLALMVAGGWSRRGDDLWLDNLHWVVIVPMVAIVIPAFGWGRRRFWSVAWYWTLAALMGIVYPILLLIAALIPLGLVQQRSHEMFYTVVYPFGFLLGMAPIYWFLIRFLRLRYFRPWTDPASWEPGDEVAPDWAKTVTGIMSPSARAHWAAQKSKAGKPVASKKPATRRPAKKRR